MPPLGVTNPWLAKAAAIVRREGERSVGISMQLPRKRHQLCAALTLRVRLPALTPTSLAPHTVARALQLGDSHCLVEL